VTQPAVGVWRIGKSKIAFTRAVTSYECTRCVGNLVCFASSVGVSNSTPAREAGSCPLAKTFSSVTVSSGRPCSTHLDVSDPPKRFLIMPASWAKWPMLSQWAVYRSLGLIVSYKARPPTIKEMSSATEFASRVWSATN